MPLRRVVRDQLYVAERAHGEGGAERPVIYVCHYTAHDDAGARALVGVGGGPVAGAETDGAVVIVDKELADAIEAVQNEAERALRGLVGPRCAAMLVEELSGLGEWPNGVFVEHRLLMCVALAYELAKMDGELAASGTDVTVESIEEKWKAAVGAAVNTAVRGADKVERGRRTRERERERQRRRLGAGGAVSSAAPSLETSAKELPSAATERYAKLTAKNNSALGFETWMKLGRWLDLRDRSGEAERQAKLDELLEKLEPPVHCLHVCKSDCGCDLMNQVKRMNAAHHHTQSGAGAIEPRCSQRAVALHKAAIEAGDVRVALWCEAHSTVEYAKQRNSVVERYRQLPVVATGQKVTQAVAGAAGAVVGATGGG
jgi:hypothetical protein